MNCNFQKKKKIAHSNIRVTRAQKKRKLEDKIIDGKKFAKIFKMSRFLKSVKDPYTRGIVYEKKHVTYSASDNTHTI